jgi:uncharacterized protein with HEPN domain
MQRDPRTYLYDVREAADKAASFAAGNSFEDYQADVLLRSAIERQLEIAGEALSQLSRVDPHMAQQISEYRSIVGLRNVLIHGYADIDNRVVWDIVQTKVPVLRRELGSLLG